MAPRRYRLIQRRKALGLTQEDLAEHAGVDRSTAGRWERGESEPQPWKRHRLARTLQVSVEQLDTLLTLTNVDGTRDADSVHGRSDQRPDLVGTADAMGQMASAEAYRTIMGADVTDTGSCDRSGTAMDDGVDRRNLLRLGGGAVLGPTAGPGGAAAGTALRTMSDGGLLAFMLRAGPRAPAPADVSALTERVQTAWWLRQRADYEALGRLLPGLLAQAEAGLPYTGDADRERLTRVLVHAWNAASSLLKKVGNEPFALVAADRAVRSARLLDDPVLTAAAQYRVANVLLAAGRLDQARTVALDAADIVERRPDATQRELALWGGLLLTAAVAAARLGNVADAWQLMGEARAGGRLLGADYADIYSIFGPTNVAIHGVQVAIALQDGAGAIKRSLDVDPDRLPSSLVERRGQFLIDIAHGHVLQRNDREAVAVLLRADEVASQEVRLSAEVRDLVRDMLCRGRAGAVPGLRDLAVRVDVAQ